MLDRSHSLVRSRFRLTLVGLVLVGIPFALLSRDMVRRAHAATGHEGMAGMDMSEAAMRARSEAWFSQHPAHPASANAATATIVDSFLVSNFNFDENHDGALTQVDTAKIQFGQAITWSWVIGTHTITSGTGSTDPNVGKLFDVASNSTSTRFTFTFDTLGTFPFFCRIHELSNMRGVVVVSAVAGVEPVPIADGRVGFLAAPFPNPSGAGASFRFALGRAGDARAEVFDVRGRRIASVLDGRLPAGAYTARWNGRTSGGRAAEPGVYWIRLSVPGLTASRRLVVVH